MPVGPPSSPSGVFLLSEAFSFEKAPEQVPSELPKVSETFLICPLMFGVAPNISGKVQLQRPLLPPNSIKTGAFSTEWNGTYRQSFEGSYSASGYLDTIVFDANDASPVFGSETTVQPASVRVLPCIKT